MALVDDALDMAAVELARQPRELNHFEALRRALRRDVPSGTKIAPAGELTAERLMCIVRIIMSSPTLRQAALEYRRHAVNIELAKRMGVGLDDRGLQLVCRGVGRRSS